MAHFALGPGEDLLKSLKLVVVPAAGCKVLLLPPTCPAPSLFCCHSFVLLPAPRKSDPSFPTPC